MKTLPWRAAFYLLVLGYLFLDLRVCHGPLRDAMRSRRDAAVAEARERGWAALVNQEPVTREQVDLAVARHLHQRGRTPAEVSAKNLAILRRAALQSIIDETLVRQHADGEGFEAPAEETAAFVAAWRAGFGSPEELAEGAASLGLAAASLDAELSRIWSRKRWLERRIEPGVTVSEEEATAWFEANRSEDGGALRPGFFKPAGRLVRQALFAEEEEARSAHESGGGDRSAFADPEWFARGEGPEAFSETVFAATEPALLPPFRSELGWHLAEVLEIEEERPLAYEELREEIVAHLEALYTEETVGVQLEKLRKVANLHVFPENLGSGALGKPRESDASGRTGGI